MADIKSLLLGKAMKHKYSFILRRATPPSLYWEASHTSLEHYELLRYLFMIFSYIIHILIFSLMIFSSILKAYD